MTTWVSRSREVLLRFARKRWSALIAELGLRGGGRREAGAFLLADRNGDHRAVRRVAYFDDLDPLCLRGPILFDGLAYSKLWDICEAEDLVVVGDAHTHPRRWVGQSLIDAANPMIAREGHVALVFPSFAVRRVSPREVGVHLYLGADGWLSWTGSEAAKRLFVGRWPR